MRRNVALLALLIACIASLISIAASKRTVDPDEDYSIGTAITDLTGPAAEQGMMGYANVGQRTHGIHFRQRCRTFVVAHKLTNTRFVFVNLDLGMTFQSLKLEVVERLRVAHPDLYALYNNDNVAISGTHTHSGPGGFSWHALYDITIFGFDRKFFEYLVDSIVRSIRAAHSNLSKGGRILVNQGLLFKSNINRSPTSYLLNPQAERDMYANEGDTDKTMTVLRFEDERGKELGMLNWFAVHCTSMNNTNKLISGDNKGYASYMFEKLKNGPSSLPGAGPFVAAFAQANEGDVSPNTDGAKCIKDGSPCAPDSTCEGKTSLCQAKGPGKDHFESTQIIGRQQHEKALELYNSATQVVRGPIEFRHAWLDITNLTVSADYTGTGKEGKTCRAAMGYSFAAGTTDGCGDFDFHQGTTTDNPFWNFIRSFLKKPTEEQIACQRPKPILIDGGEMSPLPWTPWVSPIQLITIGKSLVINVVPGEFSTMAGRRLKKSVLQRLTALGHADNSTKIVVAGLSNTYTNYITTWEEYQGQRYEAASTLYGPHTLAAYLQEFDKLATYLGKGLPVPPSPVKPMNLSSHQHSFIPPVIEDTHPWGKPFGSVKTDVQSQYKIGDIVRVEFWSAHPKNDYLGERSFLLVERQSDDGQSWQVALTDGDWATKFTWARHAIAESIATIEWRIEAGTAAGVYRIRHFGSSKSLFGHITPFEGASAVFKVVA